MRFVMESSSCSEEVTPARTGKTLWTGCATRRRILQGSSGSRADPDTVTPLDPLIGFVFWKPGDGSNNDTSHLGSGVISCGSDGSAILLSDPRRRVHKPRADCLVSVAEPAADTTAIAPKGQAN